MTPVTVEATITVASQPPEKRKQMKWSITAVHKR